MIACDVFETNWIQGENLEYIEVTFSVTRSHRYRLHQVHLRQSNLCHIQKQFASYWLLFSRTVDNRTFPCVRRVKFVHSQWNQEKDSKLLWKNMHTQHVHRFIQLLMNFVSFTHSPSRPLSLAGNFYTLFIVLRTFVNSREKRKHTQTQAVEFAWVNRVNSTQLDTWSTVRHTAHFTVLVYTGDTEAARIRIFTRRRGRKLKTHTHMCKYTWARRKEIVDILKKKKKEKGQKWWWNTHMWCIIAWFTQVEYNFTAHIDDCRNASLQSQCKLKSCMLEWKTQTNSMMKDDKNSLRSRLAKLNRYSLSWQMGVFSVYLP